MDELHNIFSEKKNLYALLVVAIITILIPLGIYLVKQTQIFQPRAAEQFIQLADGDCVIERNGKKVLICGNIPLKLTLPFATSSASESARPSGSVSSSATATPTPRISPSPFPQCAGVGNLQCPANFICYDPNPYLQTNDFLGKCLPSDQVCAQVITAACDQNNSQNCRDFPTPCHVPEGWIIQSRSPSPSPQAYKPLKGLLKIGSATMSKLVPSAYAGDECGVSPINLGFHLTCSASNPQVIVAWQNREGIGTLKKDGAIIFSGLSLSSTSNYNDTNVVRGGSYTYTLDVDQTAGCKEGGSGSETKSITVPTDQCGPAPTPTPVPTPPSSPPASPTPSPIPVPALSLATSGCKNQLPFIAISIEARAVNATGIIIARNGQNIATIAPNQSTFIDSVDLKNSNLQSAATYKYTASIKTNAGTSAGSVPLDVATKECRLPQYRLAETEQGLNQVSWSDFLGNTLSTNYQILNDSIGTKTVWVQFKDPSQNSNYKYSLQVELVEKDPSLDNLVCGLDITKQNVRLTAKGQRFGLNNGKIQVDGKDIQVLEWKKEQITGLISNVNIDPSKPQRYMVKIIRQDGQATEAMACEVGTSLLSLGAKVFCREPGKFDVSNVKLTIVGGDSSEATPSGSKNRRIDEAVTIDKDGVVQGIKAKLEKGRKYILSILAPFSLRRNALFTASDGTTAVTAQNSGPFILPIGDIAPVSKQDGKINTADKAELARQWRVLESTSSATTSARLTGDFNRDGKVNSIDWACMRYDFNQQDDIIPDSVPDDQPSQNSSKQNNASPQPSPSNSPSACASPPSCTEGSLVVGDPNPEDPNLCPRYSCAN